MALQHVLAISSAKLFLQRTAKYRLHARTLYSTKAVASIQRCVHCHDSFEDFLVYVTIKELELEEISGIIKVVIFAGDVRDLE